MLANWLLTTDKKRIIITCRLHTGSSFANNIRPILKITRTKIIAGGFALIVSLAVSHTGMGKSVRQVTAKSSQKQTSTLTKPTNITRKRQLDPQAKALLDQMATKDRALARPIPPEKEKAAARQAYRAMIPLAGPPEPVSKVENRQIPGPAGNISVRIYTPKGSGKESLPVLVYFHGGGFAIGDLDTHDAPLRALANRAGCLIVSVNYRLAPEHRFPAAPDDAYAATKWVAEHASEIGGNAKRLAVGGDSAGGNLATVVALMARDRGGPKLVYQVLLYPNTDAAPRKPYRSWSENDGYILTKAVSQRVYDQYIPDGVNRRNPYVSPLWAKDLKHLPPALVVTGEFDPLRDEGEAYAMELQQAGVPVVATRYKGMIHGFFQMAGKLDAGKKLINQTAAALRAAFASH